MKTLLIGALLSAGIINAQAADPAGLSIGAGYGFADAGMVTLHGDLDMSRHFQGQPISLRIAYDQYANDRYAYRWTYSVLSAGAYYDFNKLAHLNSKVHPFAGAGVGTGSVNCSNCRGGVGSPAVGGLYLIGGIQYALDNHIRLEASLNTWGGPTVGINYNF